MSSIKQYPFVTKSQVRARLLADDSFVLQCLATLYSLQTSSEQEAKNTVVRNHRGFMSSHAVKGSTLAVKAAGEGLSEEEIGSARDLCSRYTRQLAAHSRQVAIEADPSLAEAARVFSAG
jgi:hypothetical protein